MAGDSRMAIDFQVAPLRDAAGRVTHLIPSAVDITERKRSEEAKMLLAREVDHRAKNALAVVQSVLTLTRTEDPAAFKKAVMGRIAAMALAHTLLARESWNGADLRALLGEELAAYRGGGGLEAAVQLDGPLVGLAPGAAQAVAMAIHELATNAAKYGALSRPGGHVSITWSKDPATGGCAGLARARRAAGRGAAGASRLRHQPDAEHHRAAACRAGWRCDWDKAGLRCGWRCRTSRCAGGRGRRGWGSARQGMTLACPPVAPRLRGRRFGRGCRYGTARRDRTTRGTGKLPGPCPVSIRCAAGRLSPATISAAR